MNFIKKSLFFFALMSILIACSAEQQQRLEPIPNAYGNVNNIVLISDETMLNSEPGDTLMYYLHAAYPILPQPEPLFEVKNYSPVQVKASKERKELRTYLLLADMSDTNSATTAMVNKDLGTENVRSALETKGYGTKVVKDKWAVGQILIYLFGKDKNALLENVQKSFPGVLERIYEHDRNQIMATTFFKGDNRALIKEIRDSLGVTIRLPKDYQKAVFDTVRNVYWIRYDEQQYTYNILIHKEKYEDKSQLTREGLIAVRDTLGGLVSTSQPDTRMIVNYKDLPLYVKGTTINGNFALEARGVWEIENDFMGGPFISYLIHNPNTDELVFVDGFLFAPGKSKREPMQVLENIVKTTRF